jgi:RNA polymerase sigma factor (sigma-70 family)
MTLTVEQRRLVLDHLTVADAVAVALRRRIGPRADVQELRGDAYEGLVKAARAWKGEGSFEAFAYLVVRRSVIDALRRSWGRRFGMLNREVSLDKPLGGEEGTVALADAIADPRADTATIVEQRDELVELAIVGPPRRRRRVKTDLSGAERMVLAGAALGESMDETAARLWKSSETVKMQRKSVIRKLRARNITHAVYIATSRGLLQRT